MAKLTALLVLPIFAAGLACIVSTVLHGGQRTPGFAPSQLADQRAERK